MSGGGNSFRWLRRTAIGALLVASTLGVGSASAAEMMMVGDAADPCLNVRDRPEIGGAVLACVEPGAQLEVVSSGDLWAEVRLADGTRAWAAQRYLGEATALQPQSQFQSQSQSLPEAGPPPEPATASEPDPPAVVPAEQPPVAVATPPERPLEELTRINFDIPLPEERGGGSAVGSAETVETVGENVVVASGGVEFRHRDALLQAQRLEVDRATHDVVAEGEVIFDQGPRRMTGTRLEFNLDSRTGRMLDARVFADPDIYFTGSEIALLGEDLYRVKGGEVTSCQKENPGWSFKTANARIKLEGFARMRHTSMRVKGLPVVYLPYMVMPAKSERAAGFLFPKFGTSQRRGSYLGLAWFQPFGQSYDATIFADLFGENYTGLGTEVRYLPSESTSGRFEAYAIEDPVVGETRWKVAWDHTSGDLPLGFRGVIRVRDYSDFNFFYDFERDFNNRSIRRVESTGFLSGSWGSHSLNILVNENEAFYGSGNVVARQLPEIEYRLRSRQIGSLPLYLDVVSSVNAISIERVGLFSASYTRADLFPRLTVPLSTLPWLSVSVSGGERITWYEDSLKEDRFFGGGSRTRTFPTADALIVGPSLSRVFEKGLGRFAKFKHIIEPRWSYLYVGEYEDQGFIPRFDDVDVLRATNVWGWELVNRVLAKPEDEALHGGPREIFSLEVSQGFSLDKEQPLQASRDGLLTSQEGPLRAELRFNPSPTVSLQARARYATLFGNLDSTSLTAAFGVGRHGLGVSWYTRYNAETGEEQSDQVRLSANIELLRDRLTYGSQISYDIFRDYVQSTHHSIVWNGQCWGLRLVYGQYNRLVGDDDYEIRLALSLKNVGTFLDLTGGSLGGQF